MKKIEKSDLLCLRPNFYDYLKVLAIITMIIDHIGYYLFPEYSVFRLIGRIAFPIFLFLVGFNQNYQWRRGILLSACIVQFSTILLRWKTGIWNPFYLNILFPIVLTRIILSQLSKIKWNIWWVLWIIFVIVLWLESKRGLTITTHLNQYIDYGIFWILIGLSWFFAWKKKSRYLGVMLFSFLLRYYFFHFAIPNFWFYSSAMKGALLLQVIMLTVSTACLSFQKTNDKIMVFNTTPSIDQILVFISQKSLLIYVLHLLVLMIIFYTKYKGYFL